MSFLLLVSTWQPSSATQFELTTKTQQLQDRPEWGFGLLHIPDCTVIIISLQPCQPFKMYYIKMWSLKMLLWIRQPCFMQYNPLAGSKHRILFQHAPVWPSSVALLVHVSRAYKPTLTGIRHLIASWFHLLVSSITAARMSVVPLCCKGVVVLEIKLFVLCSATALNLPQSK